MMPVREGRMKPPQKSRSQRNTPKIGNDVINGVGIAMNEQDIAKYNSSF